ncbi:MAG: hypothetical protein JWP11_788 [Frankiales bacterium]|jgi:hypothetical protein|nr:hypothetical protein [Frankiales bacterium]
MRKSRIITITSIAVATLAVAVPAQAAGPTHLTAPYTSSDSGGSTHCLTGTTCTPLGRATSGTGRIAVSMDMHRATADQATTESGFGYADEFIDVRPPKGSTKLTATFTWDVTSATTSANADHGFLYASTLLYASASCSSCTVTDGTAALVSSSSTIPMNDNTQSLADAQKVITVTVDNLPRNATVRLYSGGTAYTDMNPSRVCSGLAPCDALPPTDAGHSGTSHASIDAGLTSVDVTYS